MVVADRTRWRSPQETKNPIAAVARAYPGKVWSVATWIAATTRAMTPSANVQTERTFRSRVVFLSTVEEFHGLPDD